MSDDPLDLDAELLALAGDEAGSDEDAMGPRHDQPTSRSSTPQSTHQVLDRHSPSEGSPSRRKANSLQSASRRRNDNSEGKSEATSVPGSPDSLGSGAMEQSDTDTTSADNDVKEDGNPYPVEGKFTSRDDRNRIMALSEVERESILAERAQEVERRNQDINLKRLLQSREANEVTKRNSTAAELHDDEPKATKPKTRAINESLENYKAERARRNDQRMHRDRNRPSPPAGLVQSDVDADEESEVEWATRKPSLVNDEPAADLKDFNHVRVGRSDFAKFCFFPGFEDHLVGCFARVSIGLDRSTGQRLYRMYQIKGFTQGTPYTMEGSNSKLIKTDTYVLVARDKDQETWPFIMCSDSNLTEEEFNRWKAARQAYHLRPPTRTKLEECLERVKGLREKRWTGEEIAEKLRRQSKYTLEKVKTSPVLSNRDRKLQEVNKSIRISNAMTTRRVQMRRNEKARAAHDARLRKVDADTPFAGIDPGRIATPSSDQPKQQLLPRPEKKGIPTFTRKAMDDELIGSIDLGIDIDI